MDDINKSIQEADYIQTLMDLSEDLLLLAEITENEERKLHLPPELLLG